MLQNARIRWKTDKRILTVLVWVYFLQIFDKVVFGMGNVFGLSKDLHLTRESTLAFSSLEQTP